MKGIIECLTLLYNRTPFIKVNSSSPGIGENNNFRPLEYGNNRFYQSSGNREEGEWWQVSLSGISCYISSYKIQTYDLPTYNAHLKSWKLYAGNSEDDLHVIHFQNETQVLNNVSALVIINLSNIYGPFSIFRVQTVSTHYYSEEYFHVLRLAEFDIYGYSTGHDCQTKNHFTLNISPSSFLIMIFLR